MVLKCCVDACSNTKRPKLAFHRFPLADPERLRQWLCALNMDVNTPLHVVGKLFVCQKHFQPDDYHTSPHQPSRRGRILRTTAVPARFRQAHTSETGDPTASVGHLDHLVSHGAQSNHGGTWRRRTPHIYLKTCCNNFVVYFTIDIN